MGPHTTGQGNAAAATQAPGGSSTLLHAGMLRAVPAVQCLPVCCTLVAAN